MSQSELNKRFKKIFKKIFINYLMTLNHLVRFVSRTRRSQIFEKIDENIFVAGCYNGSIGVG